MPAEVPTVSDIFGELLDISGADTRQGAGRFRWQKADEVAPRVPAQVFGIFWEGRVKAP